jgi:hypothetical protein
VPGTPHRNFSITETVYHTQKPGAIQKEARAAFFQQMRCFALFFAAFFVKMVLAAFLTAGVSCYIRLDWKSWAVTFSFYPSDPSRDPA